MNIHQNARLTPLGRERMVRAIASAFYRDVQFNSPFGRVVCRPPCCQAAAGSRPKRNTSRRSLSCTCPFSCAKSRIDQKGITAPRLLRAQGASIGW